MTRITTAWPTVALLMTLACSTDEQRTAITQAGSPVPPPAQTCAYRVSPVESVAVPLSEQGDFTIETEAGCAWRMAGAPDWLTLRTPLSGHGTALVQYDVSANSTGLTNLVREAPIQVRWDAPTAGQNVWVRQLPECSTVIVDLKDPLRRSLVRLDLGAEDARLAYEVLVDLPFSCPWSARSEAAG